MFYSILFPNQLATDFTYRKSAPEFFTDLNLDQIITPILKNKKEYALDEFFYSPISDKEILIYRQEIMHDLEDKNLCLIFSKFSETVFSLYSSMEAIRQDLRSDDEYDNNYLTKGHMLNNVENYCQAIDDLHEKLSDMSFASIGINEFARYLSDYCASEQYKKLCRDIKYLRNELKSVKYCMLIQHGTIRVRKYEDQVDYSQKIIDTFDKFRQGDVAEYRQNLSEKPYVPHVEAEILNLVAKLYKDIFEDLNNFCLDNMHFEDQTLMCFAREVQFYLSWLEFIQQFKQDGLKFNYPILSDSSEHLYDFEGFDIALAMKLKNKIVTNDFELNNPERIIVVSGPNQGGKTTFARTFGQLHYLAELGLCIPGSKSQLYLFDNIYTHFEKEEDLTTLNGKLKNDLIRLHKILMAATSRSIIIINEIFSSTTLSDALLLGEKMMDELSALKAPTILVTFLDKLANHGPDTVSMVSTVNQDNPAIRTYKVVRKKPDGMAYALSIAERHGLTYEQINRRLRK